MLLLRVHRAMPWSLHNVHVLNREEDWVKEGNYVQLEKHSLNRSGGLRRHLSATYNAVLEALPRHVNPHTHWLLTPRNVEDPPLQQCREEHGDSTRHILFYIRLMVVIHLPFLIMFLCQTSTTLCVWVSPTFGLYHILSIYMKDKWHHHYFSCVFLSGGFSVLFLKSCKHVEKLILEFSKQMRWWYSGKHSCLPSSWPGFDSRPSQHRRLGKSV